MVRQCDFIKRHILSSYDISRDVNIVYVWQYLRASGEWSHSYMCKCLLHLQTGVS